MSTAHPILQKRNGGMRGEQILKILQAVRLLARSKGASVQELQKELQISRRSEYRLIGTLEALGFPVEEPWYEGKAKRYRIMEEFSVNLPNLVLPPLNLYEGTTVGRTSNHRGSARWFHPSQLFHFRLLGCKNLGTLPWIGS